MFLVSSCLDKMETSRTVIFSPKVSVLWADLNAVHIMTNTGKVFSP